MPNEKQYLTRGEASGYCIKKGFPVSPKTLAKYASIGGGPKFFKFGTARVLYQIEDLDEWIRQRLSDRFASCGIPFKEDDEAPDFFKNSGYCTPELPEAFKAVAKRVGFYGDCAREFIRFKTYWIERNEQRPDWLKTWERWLKNSYRRRGL